MNHSLTTQAEDSLGQTVGENDIPQSAIKANVGMTSVSPLADTKTIKTKTLEQKAARFLSDNPTSVKQTEWMSIPLAQQTEVVDMAALRGDQSNLVGETHHDAEWQNTFATHEGRPAPNERPEPQHFPDMKSFNIEKSEVIQPDEMDITKNILEQVHAEMSEKSLAAMPQSSVFQTSVSQTSANIPQAASMASKVAEMVAALEVENPKTVASRTLSYTFNQWQNAPTASFILANANKDQVVASTQSHEVQQALQDNQHLWTGEQKMVIRREEQEGQRRQQQQQQDEES